MPSPRFGQKFVILAGYLAGCVALSLGLPEQVPPSWTSPRGDIVWLGAPMVAFLLPTAVMVIDVLLRGLVDKDPVGSHSVPSVYDAIMLRFSIFVVGVHGAVLLAMLGLLFDRAWAGQIVPLTLGFAMISIGNLLPRTRPNLAIGIRTHRTLSDRALWIRTHRSTGYLMVACGAAIVLSAIAVPRPIGPLMILLVGPVALVGAWLVVKLSAKGPMNDA